MEFYSDTNFSTKFNGSTLLPSTASSAFPPPGPVTVDTAASASLSIYVTAMMPGAGNSTMVSSELQINICNNEVVTAISSQPIYISVTEGATGVDAEIPSLHSATVSGFQSLPANTANPACNTLSTTFYSDSTLETPYSLDSVPLLSQTATNQTTFDPALPIRVETASSTSATMYAKISSLGDSSYL